MSGRHRTPSLRRRIALVITVAALTFSVLTLVIRALPLTNNGALVIAVGAPFTVMIAAGALVLAVLNRWLVLSVAAVLLVATSVAIQVDWYCGGHSIDTGSGGEHVDVRILSSNLRYGRAHAPSFVELARSDADVVTVTELTTEAVQKFYAAGIGEAFPYSLLLPAPGAGGNGIWSRHPLTALSPTRYQNGSMVAGRIRLPGVRIDPIVASVHVTSPMASFASWRNGMTTTKSRMDGLAEIAGRGAVIVAGDFNSTPDMLQYRNLLAGGFSDAVRQTGAGFAPTFPAHRWVPSLITIDHVVTRRADAAAVRAAGVMDTDHRALLATVKVPAEPSPS